MNTLLRSLADHTPEILLALLVVVVILAGMNLSLSSRLKKMQGRWRGLFDDAKGENIERLLMTHLRERMEIQTEIEKLQGETKDLTEKMQSSKRFVGLVKYDAFEDVGGAQSFALALYDERGDGVIVTSLVGRADNRVYAKPLMRGRSERNLSQEEQRAIDEARNAGPRTILS